jgi:hypothetical protein
LIGSTSNPVTIGNFGTTDGEDASFGTNPNAYGLIVRGSINAFGTYDGVSATGVQIGGSIATTGYASVTTTANSKTATSSPGATTIGTSQAVNLGGGVRIVGSVNASSYDANSTAINIGANATVPTILNQDFISSTVSHSTLALTTPLLSTFTNTSEPTSAAYGILIGAGANVTNINNVGTISAAATGDNASAIAIKDLSGTVTNVINEGVIDSQIAAGVVGDKTYGSVTALDLSANTTGVTLTQKVNANPINIYVSTTTSSSGTTTTTAATTGTVLGSTVTKTTTTSSTITTTVTTTAAGVTTTAVSTTPTTPQIIGDVLLGTGANNVQLLGGSMVGALSLGGSSTSSAQATLNVSGASYEGALTYNGNALALSVNGANIVASTGTGTTATSPTPGVLVDLSTSPLKLSSFNLGTSGVSTGTIYFAVNPAASGATPQATVLSVSGTATLGSGAGIGIELLSAAPTTQTYTVLAANSLVLTGAPQSSALLLDVPYLVNASVSTNTTAGTVSLTLVDKTAQQLGLNLGQSQALNAILTALPNDTSIQSALLNTYSKTSFLGVYNQLLPDYAGGVFQLAAAGSDAITRATSRSNDIENPAGTRGAWAEEFAFGVNRAALGATGYRGDGFGFVGGLETGGAGFGAFGVTGSFLTGTLSDPHSPGDGDQSVSEGEVGGYWQGQFKGFKADARVAGGYARFSDQREIFETDSTGAITLDRQANGAADGWTATGHFGAAYQWDIGKWFIRPAASGDYFRLYEDGFTEHGGASTTQFTTNSSGKQVDSDGFDLQLNSRTGYQATGAASLTIGRTIGTTFVWRPQLELGYRDAFAGTAGDTTARFVQGGSPFTMTPVQITGGGPTLRLGAKADTDFYELDFEAGAEERNSYYEADIRFNIRVLF